MRPVVVVFCAVLCVVRWCGGAWCGGVSCVVRRAACVVCMNECMYTSQLCHVAVVAVLHRSPACCLLMLMRRFGRCVLCFFVTVILLVLYSGSV